MAVLYVKEQGAYLQKRSQRILITKNQQTLFELPMDRIDSIAMIGNVQITAQALHALMEEEIDITHFSMSGKCLGRTVTDTSKNIFLRLAQYDLYQNQTKRLDIAKRIVANKIENQMEILRLFRWNSCDTVWREELAQLKRLQMKVEYVENNGQLMGLEGKASSLYFSAYGRMFRCRFTFPGRNKRPPRDPINVILSLGYTFLTKEVTAALEAESFEMYLGFLHGIRYGRKSLALDMMEEFRQPVIDRMTLRLFNKSMLQELDFTIEEDSVTLNEDGFCKFCRAFERWMTDPEVKSGEENYRALIRGQAKALKQAVQHKEVYEPYCLNKKISM